MLSQHRLENKAHHTQYIPAVILKSGKKQQQRRKRGGEHLNAGFAQNAPKKKKIKYLKNKSYVNQGGVSKGTEKIRKEIAVSRLLCCCRCQYSDPLQIMWATIFLLHAYVGRTAAFPSHEKDEYRCLLAIW
jgi:hypothetical protein